MNELTMKVAGATAQPINKSLKQNVSAFPFVSVGKIMGEGEGEKKFAVPCCHTVSVLGEETVF